MTKSNSKQVEMFLNSKCDFKVLIDCIPEIIFCKDTELRYTIINKKCEEFYAQRGIYDVLGKNDFEFDPLYATECVKHDKVVLETRKELYIQETFGTKGEDDYKVFDTIKTPIIDADGNLYGIMGSVRDVTQQKMNEEKLRDLSYKDQLTGLYNRTYFIEKVDEIANSEDFNVGVIIGDINGLKKINDNLGHLDGDEFIKLISNGLTNFLGEKDLAFRWGGDEFVVLLMNSNEKECEYFIEKIYKYFENEYFRGYKVGISQGFAMFNKQNKEINKVMKEADDYLYKMKQKEIIHNNQL